MPRPSWTTQPIGLQTVFAGRTTLPGLTLPANATEAEISLDASQFTDPTVTATIMIEISYDNGSSWAHAASAARPGDSTGLPLDVTAPLFQPTNPTRSIRGAILLTKGLFASTGGSLRAT